MLTTGYTYSLSLTPCETGHGERSAQRVDKVKSDGERSARKVEKAKVRGGAEC